MAKKHKDTKHEKVHKTVPAIVSRAPIKAAKRTDQAKPGPAAFLEAGSSSRAATRLPLQSERAESDRYGAPDGFEPQRIGSLEGEPELEIRSHYTFEVEAVDPVPDPTLPFFESYLPMPHRWDAMQLPDWDMDLVCKIAAEQVTLAMLEAEQVVALCQGSDFHPFSYLDAQPGFASLNPFIAESNSMASVESIDRTSEDETFAFDHI